MNSVVNQLYFDLKQKDPAVSSPGYGAGDRDTASNWSRQNATGVLSHVPEKAQSSPPPTRPWTLVPYSSARPGRWLASHLPRELSGPDRKQPQEPRFGGKRSRHAVRTSGLTEASRWPVRPRLHSVSPREPRAGRGHRGGRGPAAPSQPVRAGRGTAALEGRRGWRHTLDGQSPPVESFH